MPPEPQPHRSFLRRDMFGVGAHIPKIREIEVAKIAPNPDQPRKHFDEIALDELASSIRDKGLIQPIVVKSVDGDSTFVIVAGERRFRAIQKVGWESLPAIVTEGDVDELALIENMQREDLQPLEEAEAVDRLMKKHDYTFDEAAKVLGKSKSSVSELLSTLKLPGDIRADIASMTKPPSKSVLVELAKMDEEPLRTQWEAYKAGTIGFAAIRAAREPRKGERVGQGTSTAAPTIKDAVKGLYAFVKRASEHHEELSKDDIKVLKEAKRQVDETYRQIVGATRK